MFYTFHQNNSGGSFVEDDNLKNMVIIEAADANEANEKAKNLGIYFDGVIDERDCDCCGDRWYPASESDGTKRPESYGRTLAKWSAEKNRYPFNAIVHYASGRKRKYESKP